MEKISSQQLLRDLAGLLLHTLKTMKSRGEKTTDRSANNSRKLVSEIILRETQQTQCIYC